MNETPKYFHLLVNLLNVDVRLLHIPSILMGNFGLEIYGHTFFVHIEGVVTIFKKCIYTN